ncbi:MAG: HEAT repeat domain-containing protein [Cyanobacteria bacterium P01_A01_bin.84]
MSITPESVKQMLSSEELGDRLRGVNQIRQLEPSVGFELVQTAIKDENSRVRYSAVSMLDTLGGQDLELSLQILRDRLFNDSEIDVQAAAADCLGGLKLTQAFDDLQQIYQTSGEWIIQLSIIAALGELGEPKGFDLLSEALSSENELVQAAAVSSLGELGDSRAVSLLSPYAESSDWQIRYRVIQSLSLLGGTNAKSIIQKLAKDEVEAVSKEAQRCLSEN